MTSRKRSMLSEDWHVHSTFSDGEGTLEQNVDSARRRGLTRLGCVDHVRASSDWVGDYVDSVRSLRGQLDPGFTITAGIEAKLLDCYGTLDMPPATGLTGVDRIVIADHAVPSPDGPLSPHHAANAVAGGEVAAGEVAGWVVSATVSAMRRHPGSQIAHLFSVFPKAGLLLADAAASSLNELVESARACDCVLEVNERWRAPSAEVARVFALSGVPLVASTDSHSPDGIGAYGHVADVFERASASALVESAGRLG